MIKVIILDKFKTIIEYVAYSVILIVAASVNKIIQLDTFNGSTVTNLIGAVLPGLYYIKLISSKNLNLEKILALSLILFGLLLIIVYFGFMLFNIIK